MKKKKKKKCKSKHIFGACEMRSDCEYLKRTDCNVKWCTVYIELIKVHEPSAVISQQHMDIKAF